MKNPRTDPEYVEQVAEYWYFRRVRRRAKMFDRRGQRALKMRGLHTVVVGVPSLSTKVQICPHGISVHVRVEPLYFALLETI